MIDTPHQYMTDDLREKIHVMLGDGVPLKEIKRQTGVSIHRLRGMIGQAPTNPKSFRLGKVEVCPTCHAKVIMPCLKCSLKEKKKQITGLDDQDDPFFSSTLSEREMIRLREVQLIRETPENERLKGLLTHGLDRASYDTLQEMAVQLELLVRTEFSSDDKFVAAERVADLVIQVLAGRDAHGEQ